MKDPDVYEESGERAEALHDDAYNTSRRFDTRSGRKRGAEEIVETYYTRTPRYKRVRRAPALGLEDGGTAGSETDKDRRERLIEEWRKYRENVKARELGAKTSTPKEDNRNWFQKTWDNPLGKALIIGAGTTVGMAGVDQVMRRSKPFARAVMKGGRRVREVMERGFLKENTRFPAARETAHYLTGYVRGPIAHFGGMAERIGASHLYRDSMFRNVSNPTRSQVGSVLDHQTRMNYSRMRALPGPPGWRPN